uniref:Neur_chan_LBD domain-containing protein n=1 Tax=Steinernema glaseri TaxID=37863 RepID=A0A1I7ZG55_9BILA
MSFSLIFLLIVSINAKPDINRLFEDLFKGYNKLTRPVKFPNETVEIQFKFKLLQLLDVHEKEQVFTTNGWLQHQKWHDYRLIWDPMEYGNVTLMHIPGELLWLPDIILYNNAHGSPAVTSVTKLDVLHNGDIVWDPPVIYNSLCKIDIEWFPYDEQYCDMKFGSWTFGGYELDLVHPTTDNVSKELENGETVWRVERGIDVSEYQESVEWDLLTIVGTRHEKRYPCCDYPAIDITYSLNIRRKKLFYTINLMTPCVGLAALTAFVFYLPAESHNKIQLCISVLVALTVFFLLLIEIIPPTSLVTPLIGRYLLFTMILVTFSIITTVIVQGVHYGDDQPMSKLTRKIFIKFLGRYLLIYRGPGMPKFRRMARYNRNRLPNAFEVLERHLKQTPTKRQKIEIEEKKRILEAGPTMMLIRTLAQGASLPLLQSPKSPTGKKKVSTPVSEAIEKAGSNIHYIARTLRAQRKQENLQADWKFVAMVMDRILLVIFTITTVIGTLVALLSAPSIHDMRQPIDFRAFDDYVD